MSNPGVRPLVEGYEELRLRLDPGPNGSYRVHASTRAAEASSAFDPPFGELEIENFILRVSRPRGRRRIDTSALGEAQSFGGRLFSALFRDTTVELYRDTLARGRAQHQGVRITLCLSGAPELIDIPWEYLFDDPDFLAVSAFTPVVRYLDLPRAHVPLPVEPPLHLLGVVSSPAEHEQLDVESERDNLERALAGLTSTGAVTLEWLERPTLGALLKALQTQTFHALHYIGHGAYDRDSQQGLLLFEDESGWAGPVTGDRLGTVLHDFSSLRLVVLNACEGARTARNDPFAGVAGSLVRRDIPAVVAMQFEISDEAAIVFADGFYRPLAHGSPVDASLAAARLAMFAERGDDIEWGTPVLFMRVPDGCIFDLARHTRLRALGGEREGPKALEAKVETPAPASKQGRDPTSAPSIFINYRHGDTSGHALLLADRLRHQFGHENVHLAVDQSYAHDRFAKSQDRGVLLVLIGPDWSASLRTSGSPRHTEDFARAEIEGTLRDLPDTIISVLVDAVMPIPETLPRSLRGLCRRERVELRHASFEPDLANLIAKVQTVRLANPSAAASAFSQAPSTPVTARASSRAAVMPTAGPGVSRPRAPHVAAGVPEPYDGHYADVIEGLIDGAVVPVLGMGAGGAAMAESSVSTSVSAELQKGSSRLAEVAQRVAVTQGERRLYTAIKDVTTAHGQPGDVHRFLAELPGLLRQLGIRPRPQLIINANFDSALEQAFEDANEPFDYSVYLAATGWFVHVPWGERAVEPVATTIREPRRYVDFPIDDDGELERTIIVKIHGGVDGHEGGVAWRNNYVVTEDHYIDYLPTHNIQDHLPIQILDKLTGSRCLFLGYRMGGWNGRVFLRRIWRGNPFSENSWAIQEDPDLLEKASWSAVGHVELLAAQLSDYVTALRSTLVDRREPS